MLSETIRTPVPHDPSTAGRLLPLVYAELKRLAASQMAGERPGQTLQATALVHEAYLRLTAGKPFQAWDSRWHFFAAAAQAMRRILIESARRRRRRMGKGCSPPPEAEEPTPQDDATLLALDEALTQLETVDPSTAEVVQLRYFAGLSNQQISELMGVTPRTIDRRWSYARAWLHRALKEM